MQVPPIQPNQPSKDNSPQDETQLLTKMKQLVAELTAALQSQTTQDKSMLAKLQTLIEEIEKTMNNQTGNKINPKDAASLNKSIQQLEVLIQNLEQSNQAQDPNVQTMLQNLHHLQSLLAK